MLRRDGHAFAGLDFFSMQAVSNQFHSHFPMATPRTPFYPYTPSQPRAATGYIYPTHPGPPFRNLAVPSQGLAHVLHQPGPQPNLQGPWQHQNWNVLQRQQLHEHHYNPQQYYPHPYLHQGFDQHQHFHRRPDEHRQRQGRQVEDPRVPRQQENDQMPCESHPAPAEQSLAQSATSAPSFNFVVVVDEHDVSQAAQAGLGCDVARVIKEIPGLQIGAHHNFPLPYSLPPSKPAGEPALCQWKSHGDWKIQIVHIYVEPRSFAQVEEREHVLCRKDTFYTYLRVCARFARGGGSGKGAKNAL
jgi:hypothetical protein